MVYKRRFVEDDVMVKNYMRDKHEKKKEENYEDDYHNYTHKNLLDDNEYYLARADISKQKYFKGIANERILEFGCGLGQNIAMMNNAWGYDISKFALNKAKEKGINVIDNLIGCEFDIVFSRHVLEHVDSPIETLKTMGICLRSGGKLILVLPLELQEKVPLTLSGNQHLYGWNFRNINNLLIKSGFKPISNRFSRGSGYKKLLFLHRISGKLYSLATYLVARCVGSKELVIEAIKE